MPSDSTSSSHHRAFARPIPLSIPDFILIGLVVICALFYAVLMLDLSIDPLFFIPLLAVWLVYLLKSQHFGSTAPLDIPIVSLLVIASLGILFTPYKELFLPKLSGLILGISIYAIIVVFFRFRQRLTWMIFSLLFLSIIVTALALIGTDWPVGNHSLFDRVYNHLPSIVGKLGIEKINKNTIGGALTFFPPLLLSLLWDKGAFGRLKSPYEKQSAFPEIIYKGVLFLCFGLSLGMLVLTQSRGAWLGCAAGIYLLCLLKEKHFLWLLLPLSVGLLLFFFVRADGKLLEMLSLLDTSQEATLPGRVEIWSKALIILRDFPLTGIGLGAFGEAYRQYYASIVLPSASDVVFHAHNTLLSVAVEVGLPGVLIYSTVLGGFGAMSWKALKHKRTMNRALALGLACGIVAFLVFGLFDAFTLGRNLEIIFWVFLGCASALYVHDRTLSSSEVSYQVYQGEDDSNENEPTRKKQARKNALLLLISWLLIALVALALVNLNIAVSLLLAIISGLVVGMRYVKNMGKVQYELS